MSPGPGEYESAAKLQGELGRFGKEQRFRRKADPAEPGPGNYDIPGLTGTGAAWVMGSKARPKMFLQQTPGNGGSRRPFRVPEHQQDGQVAALHCRSVLLFWV